MERVIKLADLEAAVKQAYEKYRDDSKGEVDPRLAGVDDKQFGITVILTDGTTISHGNTDVAFPLGNLMRIPTAITLLQQNSVKELIEKSGIKGAKDCCAKTADAACAAKREILKSLPMNPLNIRIVSAVAPSDDPEGKMEVLTDNITGLCGTPAELDDKLYRATKLAANDANVENKLTEADFALYDNSANAIDITAKLESLRVTTQQLAEMGATIVADGFNPVTKESVFDGAISERIVAMMAGFGPSHHRNVAWLVRSGVPAMAGFGGGVLAIVPGVMTIAAYGPRLCAAGASHAGLHAIRAITNQLQISAFASARVRFE